MSDVHMPHQHNHDHDMTSISNQLDRIEDFQIIAEVFRQVGDPTRLRIFWFLCHAEECVTDIAYLMDMSSPAISHHLRELKTSGLIVARREGKEVYYKASDNEQAQLLHHMIEKVMQISCPQ